MTNPAPQRESRSLRVYSRLLELYPTEFLQRHRAEMLQNFEDLENASSSRTAFWLLVGKDLLLSIISRNIPKSIWGHAAPAFIVLAAVLAVLPYSPPKVTHPELPRDVMVDTEVIRRVSAGAPRAMGRRGTAGGVLLWSSVPIDCFVLRSAPGSGGARRGRLPG